MFPWRSEPATRRRDFLLLAGLGFGALSCCTEEQQPPDPLADLRFADEPPLRLKAAAVEILTLYQPDKVDLAFPVPPVRAMQNWARDRLRANGEGGPARFTITDAHTAIEQFPVQPKTLVDQIAEHYSATVTATLALFDPERRPLAAVTIRGTATRDVRQSAPPSYREQARFLVVRDVMRDFDRDAENRIRANLGTYLVPAAES